MYTKLVCLPIYTCTYLYIYTHVRERLRDPVGKNKHTVKIFITLICCNNLFAGMALSHRLCYSAPETMYSSVANHKLVMLCTSQ